jgi:hypothetical protein
MAEGSREQNRRLAQRLATAMAVGLALTVIALAWPTLVRGEGSAPVITGVEVTSSKDTFFYSPLTNTGGTVYFNNEVGEGADQIITVTVTVADDNPTTFEGGEAFGVAPSTTISNPDGTWSVTYTIRSSDGSQNDIPFTITDGDSNTDVITITFTRDITSPGFVSDFNHVPDADSGNDGFAPFNSAFERWEDDLTADFTWTGTSDNPGGSGMAGYRLSSSGPVTTAFYTTTSGGLTVSNEGIYNVLIRAQDKVGNLGSTNFIGPIQFDRDAPRNGRLNLNEESGGEYLYIADDTGITSGTFFYSNLAVSSFTVTADDSGSFKWGDEGSYSWKVAFSPGWGEGSASEDFSSPFTHTYTINPSGVITDVFTVYYVNKAGNVLSITIDAVLDTQAPGVVFNNVTDPDYDPDGDELDYGDPDDNWYRTSGLSPGGWSFTTDVTEAESGVQESFAYWNHSIVTNNQTIPAPDGDGTFYNVGDDSDGTVQVTVAVTDNVNNAGIATLEIQLDGTAPSISASAWSESSGYLTLKGDVLYFNAEMPSPQIATTSGTTADGSSGLDYVAFEQKTNLTSTPVIQSTTGNWSTDYSFNPATEVGADSVQVTVYDHVGNLVTHIYDYIGVNDQLGLAFDNVTEPGYDAPPNDRLDDIGNWYAENDLNAPPGNGWWFHAVVTPANGIDIVEARATWEHGAGPPYYQVLYEDDANLTLGPNSLQGIFENVRDDPSGLVNVTITITDAVNRVATDTLLIRLDKDGPAITGDGWTEDSDYLYADGSTLYFSHLMGGTEHTATLHGHADDGPNGAGAAFVTFTPEPLLGFSSPDPSLPDWSIQYLISDASLDTGSPVGVTIEDNLGNQTTRLYPYVLDVTPPTVPSNFVINTPPVKAGYYDTRSLDLSWNVSIENGSGLVGYYLDTINPPFNLYPPGTTGTIYNTGRDGTFTFYLMAKDNVGHTSLTSTGPITVDTQGPISEVAVSPEEAERRFLVQWSADDITWPTDYDVQYRANSGSWTPWLVGTTSVSQYFGPSDPEPVETNGFYEFRVRARDYVDNQGDWSEIWGGSLTRRFAYVPVLLKNANISIPAFVSGDFESGTFAGWKAWGALPYSIVTGPLPPGGGSYAALLGSPDYGCGDAPNVPIGRAIIQAYASVPSGSPYLRFDYRVLSYDSVRSSGGEWWDRLEVQVSGTIPPDVNGSHHGDSNPYGDPDPGNLNCANLYDSGWQQGEINLSAYAGQVILLTFFNENHADGYWNTYTYLDNIRIED